MTQPGPANRVAILLSRFPTVTETFILREVVELERQGQPVRLVPLLKEDPPVVHPAAVPWVRRALYTPLLSAAILAANIRALVRRPGRYVRLLSRLVLSSLRHPRFLLHTLAIFPKSVYLARRLEAEGVRHVHAHFASHPATAAHIIATFSGLTYSITVHAHDLFVPRYKPYLRPKLTGASFIRVISAYNRDYLLDHYPEVDPGRVHVIHVGVPAEQYRAGDDGDGDGNGSRRTGGPVRVVTVAGLRPYKGIPVLLEACRRLLDEGLDLQCEIVGDGPLRPQIEALHRDLRLGDHVRLAGAQPEEAVRLRLQQRPIFALPSVILEDGWMEGIPVALMEAMASGAPVVASRLSGIPELVVHEETGLLTEPGDAAALAAAIRRLAESPSLAARLAAAGREKVAADFDLSRCVAELLERLREENAPADAAQAALAGVRRRFPAADPRPLRIHDGRDAWVAELGASAPELPSRLVLKVHRDFPRASRPAVDRARHERAMLDALRGPGIPRLLDLDHPAATVLTEAAAGRPLDALVRRARLLFGPPAARLERALTATGRTLATLQSRTRACCEPDQAIEAWWNEAGRDLQRAAAHLSADTHDAALRALERARDELRRFSPVLSHGDLWPGNVLVDGDAITFLDFEGMRPGLPCEDVEYFLLQLELFFDRPLLRRRFPRFRDAFLTGYEGTPPPAVVVTGCKVSKALQVLARSGAAGQARRRGRLVRILERALA